MGERDPFNITFSESWSNPTVENGGRPILYGTGGGISNSNTNQFYDAYNDPVLPANVNQGIWSQVQENDGEGFQMNVGELTYKDIQDTINGLWKKTGVIVKNAKDLAGRDAPMGFLDNII